MVLFTDGQVVVGHIFNEYYDDVYILCIKRIKLCFRCHHNSENECTNMLELEITRCIKKRLIARDDKHHQQPINGVKSPVRRTSLPEKQDSPGCMPKMMKVLHLFSIAMYI